MTVRVTIKFAEANRDTRAEGIELNEKLIEQHWLRVMY